MAALDFPTSPTTNQTYSANGNIWTWNGASWISGSTTKVFYENDLSVTTSYSITAGKGAHSVGPITIAGGVVVTIPNGSRWVIA